jgi:signal transduction histidine kinase
MFLVGAGFAVLVFSVADLRTSERHARHSEEVLKLGEISRGIHPAILSKGGLGPALKMLARRSRIPVQVDLKIESRLPPPIEVAAYYVVSEALTNTAKHSRASVAHLKVQPRDGRLCRSATTAAAVPTPRMAPGSLA